MKHAALISACVLLIAACVPTAPPVAAPNAVDQAIRLSEEPAAFDGLATNRRALMICAVNETARQKMFGNHRPSVRDISPACARYEIAYRSSVMAHVNPALRHRREVLVATSATASRSVYQTGINMVAALEAAQ